jgi:hemolysin activation/secretion protein
LRLEIEEAPPYLLQFGIANDQSPSVGAERLSGLLVIGSLTGLSDPFEVELGVSEGVRDFAVDYNRPVLPDDTRVFGSLSLSYADVVEEPFSSIDVESKSQSLTFGASKPVIRTLGNEVRLSAAFDHKRSKTFLLGEPFSFSEGVENGESVVNAFQLTQQWNHRQRTHALALRSIERIGFDFVDSTRNRSGIPDGQFVSWIGQVQYATRVLFDWQAALRGDVQLSADGLLPIERIAIGGANTVRGYRENQLVVDSGWVASLELRIPIDTQPALGTDVIPGDLLLVPFLDGGGGWNLDTPDPTDQDLFSAGAGLRWKPGLGLSLSLDVGVPLKELEDSPDDDLQDMGIHFRISTTFDGGFPVE